MGKCTFIDGIASSQALDTSGEVVDLKGLDISSLIGAAINYEHKKDFPAQIIGKIVESKKIYGKEDCENPRHLYYWNIIQLPFLYIKARLFDDKKPSSQEVAALFRDDAEHPTEENMLGFSVEGSKIEKVGAVITRSIARLVTLAHMPANKTCISEMIPDKEPAKPGDISELFKGEMQLFEFEPSYVQILEKKEDLKKDVGTGNGAFIGSEMAMSEFNELAKAAPEHGWSKPQIYKTPSASKPIGMHFNHPSHGNIHVGKTSAGSFEVRHNKKLVGVSADAGKAATHAKHYMTNVGKMEKALTAGSGMAAPSQLVGGAALAKEDLPKKMHKKEKSKWYDRADEAYRTWDKKEHFRKYMKERMPHLADGEVDAIGRVLALKKNLKAEGQLSKMYSSYANKKSQGDK